MTAPAVPVRNPQKAWLHEHLPAGISYRQFDWWVRRGFIRMPGRGSGYNRVLDETELYVAEWMGRLTRAGITASVAAELARQIAEQPAEVLFEIAPGVSLHLDERFEDQR